MPNRLAEKMRGAPTEKSHGEGESLIISSRQFCCQIGRRPDLGVDRTFYTGSLRAGASTFGSLVDVFEI